MKMRAGSCAAENPSSVSSILDLVGSLSRRGLVSMGLCLMIDLNCAWVFVFGVGKVFRG